MTDTRSTYAGAGVDIAAGERAVELLRPWADKATRPEVMGGLGGFAGLFKLDLKRWKHPVLASSTDGVGTKLAIAQTLGKHDTIGLDLVGMVVDDVVASGAEPLFLQDYIACGRVVPERIAEIAAGIADGCSQAGCALIGGEIAEHPGMLGVDEYDVAGTAVGVVEEEAVLSPALVKPGDAIIAMGSSGLHSNGYALVRYSVLGAGGLTLDAHIDQLGQTLGEELLTPTRIYSKDCLALIGEVEVHGLAHVTGGGLASNLARVLPADAATIVNRSSWTPQPIFDLVATRGRIDADEMERTFNMGVGMVAVVAADDADRALAVLIGRGVPTWIAGEVVRRDDSTDPAVRVVGDYASAD